METPTAHLDIDGYRIAYTERGRGDPVLLVHGSVSDYRTWQEQLEFFGARFRTIAYSRRFHWPNEPIPSGADYAMDRQVADLAAVIEMLDVAPARLVGHSYGAYLCLLLAMRRPDLVRALVLAEPPVVPLFISDPPRPAELISLLATQPRTALAVMNFGARGLAPATKAFRNGREEEGLRIFGTAVLGAKRFAALSDARLGQVRDNLIPAEFLGSGFASLNDAEVRRVDKPVLLMTGARSPALFHHLCSRLGELLPDRRHIDIPEASHIVHEDNAPAFDQAVMTFLAEGGGESCR